MVGEVVTHIRFGRGNVTAFDERHIEIAFDDGSVRIFAYPMSVRRFLRFDRDEAQRRAEGDCEQAEQIAREREMMILEEQRRKTGEEARQRAEALREKKAATAKRRTTTQNKTKGRQTR